MAAALYRALAMGEPVPDYGVAALSRTLISEVLDEMSAWPSVARNPAGRIVAFGGLSLTETPHCLTVEGRALFTSNAWDALAIPAVLEVPATIATTCPVSGTDLVFRVGASGRVASNAPDARLGLAVGDPVAAAWSGRTDHSWSFVSRLAADAWFATRDPHHRILPVQAARDLARERMVSHYGEDPTGGGPPRVSPPKES